VAFNAVSNTQYQIVVAGLGTAQGEFVVSWEFEVTSDVLPVITAPPFSRAVFLGGATTFMVGASGSGLLYQWFFNGVPILGATASQLPLANIQQSHIGRYTVRVTNNVSRWVESLPANLEIGDLSSAVSFGKIEDLMLADRATNAFPGLRAAFAAGLVPESAFRPVPPGSIGGQMLASGASADWNYPTCSPCAVTAGYWRWFGLTSEADGLLTIDTIGSINPGGTKPYDTLLAVYARPPNPSALCGARIRCDDNGAPDGLRSRLSFRAGAGAKYLVGVGGVNSSTGIVHLQWSHCPAPASFEMMGGLPVLKADTNDVAGSGLSYVWYRDNTPFTTNLSNQLGLPSAPAEATPYRVAIRKGTTTQKTDDLGILLQAQLVPGQSGMLQFRLSGLTPQQVGLEYPSAAPTNDCGGRWYWKPFTSYSVAQESPSELLLSIPVPPGGAQIFRVRSPMASSGAQ
jgi:hypothetical protein